MRCGDCRLLFRRRVGRKEHSDRLVLLLHQLRQQLPVCRGIEAAREEVPRHDDHVPELQRVFRVGVASRHLYVLE